MPQAEARHERRLEPGPHQLAYQGGRRVVAPARAPLVGVHDALEHAAEDVGGDVVAIFLLAHREVEPLEQRLERIAPIGVAPLRRAVAALEGGRLEQAAVQERQLAEGAGAAGAVTRRPVERAETQRVEDVPVEAAAGRDALVKAVDEIAPVPVEPSLLLDEI